MIRIALAPVLITVLTLIIGVGLDPSAKAQNADEQPAPQAVERPAPYDPQLERLSEILGSVHYLRELCGADEGQTWRSKMSRLIESENPSEARRARMVTAFNRGYRGFQRTHNECSDSSRLLIDRFMREGSDLAQGVASRYGE